MSYELERETRQRMLAARALADYSERKRSLGSLISVLESLAGEMNSPSDWRERFEDMVGKLEISYAVALDRGVIDNLPRDHQERIDNTVRRINELMDELMHDHDVEE